MCRILAVKSNSSFNPTEDLKQFANISQNSKEFQGHGWGITFESNETNETENQGTKDTNEFNSNKSYSYKTYKNINPIWEDKLTIFPNTNCLISHTRSAFEDKGIVIENNMPFEDKNYSFIFNGELRGVKIRAEGRIGAEKIFNFIKKMIKQKNNQIKEGFETAIKLIKLKTEYVRGMNIILLEKSTQKLFITNIYNENEPDYYQMYYKTTKIKQQNKENQNITKTIICSDPYLFKKEDWSKIKTDKVMEF